MLQKLGLHYRVMLLCTGDMGFASARPTTSRCGCPSATSSAKFLPAPIANLSRRGARHSLQPTGGKSDFVHTLNGSGLAVGRAWLAIMENYQQADGSILIPEALVPYMGVDRIPAI